MLVDTWINEIDRDFDHVLILEHLETSLAVMMIKFCWSLDDVVHLKLNSMRHEDKKLSKTALRNLHILNWADFKLYQKMTQRLWEEVDEIGKEIVDFYVLMIEKRIEEYKTVCVEPPSKDPTNTNAWLSSIKIKQTMRHNQTCHMLTQDMSNYIVFEKLLRWKNDYPDSFKMVEEGDSTARETILPKTKVFELCMNWNSYTVESFNKWLEEQEPHVRWFFWLPTNQYDIRQYWPNYVKDFVKPYNAQEQMWGTGYRRIFN